MRAVVPRLKSGYEDPTILASETACKYIFLSLKVSLENVNSSDEARNLIRVGIKGKIIASKI